MKPLIFVLRAQITKKRFTKKVITKRDKGAWQGNPVSAYLFIVCLEILFMIVKNNKDIKSPNILGNTFLDTACADDTIF